MATKRVGAIQSIVDPKRQRNVAIITNIEKAKRDYNVSREIETFFVGSKQYAVKYKSNAFLDLFTYLEFCFDSIGHDVSKLDLKSDYHKVILQFIYTIASFNHKLNFRHKSDKQPVFKQHPGGQIDSGTFCGYKILKDTNILRAECVWYENGAFLFQEKLILEALESTTNKITISISDDIKSAKLPDKKDDSYATDITCLDSTYIPKLTMLFLIAEHAANHLFENIRTDYINHENFGHSCITSMSYLDIKPMGNIKDLIQFHPNEDIFRI